MSLDNEIANADEEIGGVTPVEQVEPVAFVASTPPEATKEVESNRPWSSDQSVSTLGEQTDDVILAHLAEYVGSNILNSTINGAIIEEAQRSASEMMEILSLDEDELAERDDLTSAAAVAAKAKAQSAKASRETSERIQEAVKADREEQRREEFQKQWENTSYDVGNLKLNGKQIGAMLKLLADPKERPKLIEDYRKEFGGTEEEADSVLSDAERYLKAKKRYEYLKAINQLDQMTPQEKADLELIKTKPKIVPAIKLIEEKSRVQSNALGVGTSSNDYQADSTQLKIASSAENDSGTSKKPGFGSSAASEYMGASPAIQTTVTPQAEFNILANPATATIANANIKPTQNMPPVIVAEKKVAAMAVDMA